MELLEIFLTSFIVFLGLDLIKNHCIAYKHTFTFSKNEEIVTVVIISPYKIEGKMMFNVAVLQILDLFMKDGKHPKDYDLVDVKTAYTLHFH